MSSANTFFCYTEIMDNEYWEPVKSIKNIPLRACPKCGEVISAMPGSRDSVCKNCGYKDPCCEE